MMNLKIRYIFWLNTYLNSKYRKQSVDYCKASAETGIKQGTFQKNYVYFKTVGTCEEITPYNIILILTKLLI
jgi:hypothetical protein